MFYDKLLQQMRDEYSAIYSTPYLASQSNPCKSTIVLDRHLHNGTPKHSFCSMPAVLPLSKWYGCKVISYKETEKHLQRESRTVLFKPNGELAGVFDSAGATGTRCGIMCAMALQASKMPTNCRIGIIGCGYIGGMIVEILSNLRYNRFVYRTKSGADQKLFSYSAPARTELLKDQTPSFEILRECDVIITATTANKESDLVGSEKFPIARLFISLDGGYLLDESFYNFHCYSDDPEQLFNNWDTEFPYDAARTQHKPLVYNMTALKDSCAVKQVVYVYGVAAMDIVVAKHFYETGVYS